MGFVLIRASFPYEPSYHPACWSVVVWLSTVAPLYERADLCHCWLLMMNELVKLKMKKITLKKSGQQGSGTLLFIINESSEKRQWCDGVF